MATAEPFFVTRTMQAIEVLTFGPATAPQIAGALQVHPRTARRLLNRLVADGWLTRTEGTVRTYAPTMRIVALAAQLVEHAPLAHAARPVVERLHEETQAVAHLDIPSYRSALCLVQRAGCAEARPQLRELAPAHATAGGKLLLAFRDLWRESVLARPLERVTARTITDADELRAAAGRIRAEGVALEDGELEADLRGVAAPVRDASGDVTAALAVSAPAEWLPADGLIPLAARVAQAADEVSVALREAAAHG